MNEKKLFERNNHCFSFGQMKENRGEGISRPQKPANDQRFSIYQGRTPRFDNRIHNKTKAFFSNKFSFSVY